MIQHEPTPSVCNNNTIVMTIATTMSELLFSVLLPLFAYLVLKIFGVDGKRGTKSFLSCCGYDPS